jgi:hypothetical protein
VLKHWKYLLASSMLLAIFIATGALAAGEGDPLTGGERNPEANQSQQLGAETEIIGLIAASTEQTGGYVTRQSNTRTGADAGGAAIYGCRAQAGGSAGGKEACLRATNQGGGLAVEFVSTTGPVGLFQVGPNPAQPVDVAPFTTNATAVATGLNADRVDGLEAQQIENRAARQANLFARIAADGTLVGNRGAASSTRAGTGDYRIVFEQDISACAYNATVNSSQNPLPGPIGAQLQGDTNNTVRVRTYGDGGPDQPGDRPVHLTVTC